MRADPSLVAPLHIRTPHASQQSPVERILSLEVGHGLVVGTEVPPRAGRPALGGHLLKPPRSSPAHSCSCTRMGEGDGSHPIIQKELDSRYFRE
jgi:hypothetical protein